MIFLSLTQIYNLSILQSKVPTDWKKGKISPIYKGKGTESDPSNYRPISVLSHLSKIIEKHVNSVCLTYFQKHDFFSTDQSAFLKHHSTITSLHKVNEDWLESIENGEISLVCYFDLKKCFDTLCHKTLLFKLEKYDFNHNSIAWFKSYLQDRNIATFCHNTLSDFQPVNIGVPQGSVLGPFLFLIFINDFPLCVSHSNLFADDTMISASSNEFDLFCKNLQSNVTEATEWFSDNKLAVNIDKSCTMVIGSQQRITKYCFNDSLDIVYHNKSLSNKDSYCYLGLEIDSCLTWNNHITKLSKKLGPVIAQLQRIRPFLSQAQLNTLYFSFVQPHIDYGLTIWGFSSKTNIQKIQRFQNRAARIITNNFDFSTSATAIIRNLKWLNVIQRRDYLLCILTYKSLHDQSPNYLSDLLTRCRDVHTRKTRLAESSALQVPFGKTQYFHPSFQIQAPNLWNNLPASVKNSPSLQIFKNNYKSAFSHNRMLFYCNKLLIFSYM